MRLLSFCLRMIRSILETALVSHTEIIRMYRPDKNTEKKRGGGRGGGGEAEGLSCLIDSVKRRAGDVNGWVLPFPRSGQMAAPCPGGRWQTARRGPGPGPREPTAGTQESISHPLPSQKCYTKGQGCRTRPLPLHRDPLCPPREKGGTCARAELAPFSSGGRGGTRVLVPMEEEKVRAGVSGCKHSWVFNKYYLYNCGGLGTSRSETKEY